MTGYSIVILICSLTLSHADCQPNTALDVVRGPPVDNPAMCSFNAQAMLASTDLLRLDQGQYMKVVCASSKSAEQWRADIEARNVVKAQ